MILLCKQNKVPIARYNIRTRLARVLVVNSLKRSPKITWQSICRLISSARWNTEMRFQPFVVSHIYQDCWIMYTIRERIPMTQTRIKGLLDSFLQFWPQFRYVDPEQSFEYPNRDGVMRIYGSHFKSIEGMFHLQSLHNIKISEQSVRSMLLWSHTSSIAWWNDNWSGGQLSTSLIWFSEATQTRYDSRAGIANGAESDCDLVLAWMIISWCTPYEPAYSLSR